MKQPYQLLLDVWDGRPNIDWDVMNANDVAGAIVRLNDMSGGHHMDENFPEMWKLLGDRGKARAPYFVFNPWVSGKANFDWLMAHTPWGGRHFIDIEVRKEGLHPDTYMNMIYDFKSRMQDRGIPMTIYTGLWFTPIVTRWPTDVSYWWAAYSTALTNCRSWTAYRSILSTLTYNNWIYRAPGGADNVPLWQCSGDGCVLPGMAKDTDVNVYPGTLESLKEFLAGHPAPEPVVEEITDITVTLPLKTVVATSYVNVRKTPSILGVILDRINPGQKLPVLETKLDGQNKWIRIGINQWAAEVYNGRRYVA